MFCGIPSIFLWQPIYPIMPPLKVQCNNDLFPWIASMGHWRAKYVYKKNKLRVKVGSSGTRLPWRTPMPVQKPAPTRLPGTCLIKHLLVYPTTDGSYPAYLLRRLSICVNTVPKQLLCARKLYPRNSPRRCIFGTGRRYVPEERKGKELVKEEEKNK